MDTLFRLVSFQSDQSFNSSRTSSSSRSSRHNNNNFNSHYQYHHQPEEEEEEEEEEECCNNNNFYMDEDDFSSSSSKHFFPYHQQQQHTHPTSTATPTTTTTTASSSHAAALEHSSAAEFGFSPAPDLNLQGFVSDKWATNLLMETARSIADKNSGRVQQLMWMLNELSSPYGDTDQKLASYFLQALFCRMTDSGDRCYRTLTSASDKTCSFESTRKMVLKFQEVSPWTTFGHVACNGAILEALEGESRLHIVDISNTYCTQWPTLLEALATRTDDTPHLRLTTVVASKAAAAASGSGGGAAVSVAAAAQKVMKEIGNRMEKFARLMGVPFKFKTVHHVGDLSDMDLLAELDLRDDEALAINCVGTLHTVAAVENRREAVLATFRKLRPKIVTVVEEEAELDSVGIGMEESSGFDFLRGFQECVRWFRVYLESLDESFPRTNNERLMLERAAGRALVDLLACPPAQSSERRESAARWSHRLRETGFNPIPFSDDVSDDVRALLRRYREGCWSMTGSTSTTTTPASSDAGLFLAWKEQPVVWACAWKPFS